MLSIRVFDTMSGAADATMKLEIPPTPTRASSTSRETHERTSLLRRGRRHSYDTFRPRSMSLCNADAIFVRVDLFLGELKRRLDRLDKYTSESRLQLDAQLERGYHALCDVRDSCSSLPSSDLLWGAARHRAGILVETLETKYNELMPTRETFEQKAQVSMKVMESYLSELESRTHAGRNGMQLMAATREILEDGYDKAKHAKDVLSESIAHALSQARETRLIHYDDLPQPWRGNPHILKGYRFNETSFDCIVSMFHPSNETINIWSHLIGLFIVLGLALYFYPATTIYPLSTKWDILIAGFFFAAACKCLICSTMWHTMNSIADKCILDRFACVDYSGIALLVAASILSTEWTAFYCEPVSRTIYMSLTIILGIAGSVLPWRESFNRHDMAWFRVVFYVTLAATGFAPVIQLNYTRGPQWTFYFYAPIAKSVMVYFTGALIYASQVPEKWWPGKFDYAGASHNIWHLAVLGGILFHYVAMQEFFKGAFARKEDGCCLG